MYNTITQEYTSNKIYSGFWVRSAASLIDSLILALPTLILIAANLKSLCIIPSLLYFSLMESSRTQATLGKMALGIIVEDENGNKISFGKAAARYFCKYVSAAILYIGYIMIPFNIKKQGYHDIVLNTYVIKKVSIAKNRRDNYYVENTLILKFEFVLLLVIGIFIPLISLLIKANTFTILLSVGFCISIIATGIEFKSGKKWAWWASSIIFAYYFASNINLILTNTTIPNNDKIFFIPFITFFLISLLLLNKKVVLDHFSFSEKSKYFIYAQILILVFSLTFFVITHFI